MKNLFVLILFISVSLFASADKYYIDIIDTTVLPTRNEVPQVELNSEDGILNVSMDGNEEANLEVTDGMGTVIYEAPIIATGIQQTHIIPVLGEDSYTITITSNNKIYEGSVDIQ